MRTTPPIYSVSLYIGTSDLQYGHAVITKEFHDFEAAIEYAKGNISCYLPVSEIICKNHSSFPGYVLNMTITQNDVGARIPFESFWMSPDSYYNGPETNSFCGYISDYLKIKED